MFSVIPNDIIQPLFRGEVSNRAAAGSLSVSGPTLLVGQGLGTGFVSGVPLRVYSQAQVDALCRPGSMASRMTEAYLSEDPDVNLWLLPLTDVVAGVAASKVLTFTGPATAAGVVSLYIGGRLLSVPVEAADSATNIGDAIVALLGTNESAAFALGSKYAVTAANNAGAVTFTARHKGAVGNTIDLRVNYLGTAGAEALPAGVAITELASVSYVHLASGATDPDLATIGAMLGDRRFEFIANPYTVAPALAKWKIEMSDSAAGRWGYMRQVYGGVFSSLADTAAGMASFSASNDPHMSISGIEGSPTPADEMAAAYCGSVAASIRIHPVVPLEMRVINWIKASNVENDKLDWTERQLMLVNGITPLIVNDAGEVCIQRCITTFNKNSYGGADDSYFDISIPYQNDYVMMRLKNVVDTSLANKVLVADNAVVRPGGPFIKPKQVISKMIAEYAGMEYDGIVENTAVFARLVTATIGAKGVLEVGFRPDYTEGLHVFKFLLEYRRAYSAAELAM
jgi:phage tail sheath gpL-like